MSQTSLRFEFGTDSAGAPIQYAVSGRPVSARGEIIGGSQRIHDHGLPLEVFQWYLDVRKYGTFPHSGFGMGLERFTAWMCGVPHLRECIPYPRMLYRIYP